MNLDFIYSLNNYINSLNLYAESYVGILDVSDSISVIATPGGINQIYYDGVRDQDYNIQFTTKSKNQSLCVDALNTIMNRILLVNDIPSLNDSYTFNRMIVGSPPSFIGTDEQGYFVWQLSSTAKLTINQGVI